MVHKLAELRLELCAPLAVAPGKEGVCRVVQMYARHERRGDDDRVIAPSAVRHILPDEHTEPVAMVVPAQRLDLDMLAQHIEAHRLGGADIVDKRLIRRCGIESVRPVALIKQTVLEVWLVIQEQPRHSVFVLCDGYLAHRKVAEHLVLPAAYAEAVELWVLRAPRLKARHGDLSRERIVLSVKMRVCLLVSPYVGLDRDRCLVNIRGDAQRAHIRLRYGFEPHRLPYTALRSVPYSAAL